MTRKITVRLGLIKPASYLLVKTATTTVVKIKL
jgi:hypothetical protein